MHFEDSGDWYSLPEWAEYFIGIGKQLACADQLESRIVTAIVVPTRAFGAAYVSLGMVISDAAARDSSSAAAHFENLLALAAGTPVIFRQGPRKVLKGVLKGTEEYNGNLHVRVQVQSRDPRTGGGLTYLIDKSRALLVQPAKHSGKLPKKQGGENKRFANSFVDTLLGDADPVQLGIRSKLVCAIVGKKSSLEYEIRHTPLALHTNGNCQAEGQLQDVLRIDRFVSGEQSYRSALVPVGSSPPSGDVISKVEIGVVFDGAAGFLKWGSMWPDRHQVIILDRTELYFDDAITAINCRFSQNRADASSHLPAEGALPGGEVLVFREAIP
ncbi:MAG: hypothetical protein SFX18_19940 [Pirellulales bacterium]|nr:hypothetical protein [Pirellulales bacterium]